MNKELAKPHPNERVNRVAKAMRARAADFARRASVNLVLGIVMLLAGVPLFMLAGNLGSISFSGDLIESSSVIWAAMLSVVIVRIAIVAYMVFVARVFLQLYRHLLQFNIFYSAFADALNLIDDTQIEHLHSIGTALYPQGISKEKLPESPTKEVLQLVEGLAKITKAK